MKTRKPLDISSVLSAGGYHTALILSAQIGVLDVTCSLCLRLARTGSACLGRRNVFRLDDSSTGGHRSAGGPGPVEAVAAGFATVFRVGMGRSDPAAGHRYWHDQYEFQWLSDGATLRPGDDGP